MLNGLLEVITSYIVLPYLLAVILGAYAFKDYLCAFFNHIFYRNSTKAPSDHWVVFFIGAVIALPFLLIPSWRPEGVLKTLEDGKPALYSTYGMRIFITYTVATSFYDLIVGKVIGLIKGKIEETK